MTATAVKERGVLFSAPMVRALLSGSKTQTRRTVTRLAGIGPITEFGVSDTPGYAFHCRDGRMSWNDFTKAEVLARCPYGKPGDRLYVKETYLLHARWDFDKPSEVPRGVDVWYDADRSKIAPPQSKWGIKRSSLFMPRWASRITLEITDVRVERLQDISESDAWAEGVQPSTNSVTRHEHEGRNLYWALWDSINGEKHPWESNPWVFVIEFKRVTP